MELSQRIRTLRQENGLSQADLEQRTGLRRQYISRVENGRTVPSLDTLEKLAGALGVPLYRLFYKGVKPPRIIRPNGAAAHTNGHNGDLVTARLMRLMLQISESDRQLLFSAALKMSQTSRMQSAAD